MSEHEQICNLLADLITEQARTTSAIVQLSEAIAGVRTQVTKAKAETEKVIAKAKTEPAAPATATEAPAPVSAPTATAPTMDYKRDVAPTMAKLLAAKGAPAVVAILASFGVKKGAELPTDKLAEALAAANSALES